MTKFLLKTFGGVILCLFLLLGFTLVLLGGMLGSGGVRYSPFSLGAYPGSADGSTIVQHALQMAAHLHNCPPENLDQCWDAAFPQDALAYWARKCPGCLTASNGDLQCVMFDAAAYGLSGIDLPIISNAVDFWANYQKPQLQAQGWLEVPSGSGLPMPGDMAILSSPYFGGAGHMAIVVDVKPPVNGQDGKLIFAQANGPGSVNAFPLPANLVLHTWTNYTVLGYIRHVSPLPAGLPGGLPNSPYVAVAVNDANQAHILVRYFVAQINQESGFNPSATSSAGAEGIAQLMPATAAGWGVDPWNPIASLWAAAHHMAQYQNQYGGNYGEALAAYNAGAGALTIALQTAARLGGNWLDYLPPETQNYVKTIMAA